jgi:hypothetical protein
MPGLLFARRRNDGGDVFGRIALDGGDVAAGVREAASSLLQGVHHDSKRYGFVGLEFASDLALAELANKTKHGVQAQVELHALQKSATSKGFGLIARKALQESSAH